MEDHPLKVHRNRSRLRAVILSPSISKLQNAQRQFGQRIQTQREHKGISQEQLSKDCGITLTNLKLLESGEAEARLFTVISIAEVLGTTVEDLLRGIE
jgi:DNA-binding XRE family transcriptional regulator